MSHPMETTIGFATGQRSDSEEQCVHLYASLNGIPYRKFGRPTDVPPGWIPVGTIDWFEQVTGWKTDADSYPEFLSGCLKRKVWRTDDWPLGQRVFIKPADKLKRFNGKVIDGSYKGKKRGPYFCSEVVDFLEEWRYYVADGKVLDAAWYAGRSEENPPDVPSLDEFHIEWPKGWVGGVDFGMTADRGLCLVECHEPFAVGNYLGLNSKVYPEWIIAGWEYLKKKYGGKMPEKDGNQIVTVGYSPSGEEVCVATGKDGNQVVTADGQPFGDSVCVSMRTIDPGKVVDTVPSRYRLGRRNGELVLQGVYGWRQGWTDHGGDWKDIPIVDLE